MKHGMTNYVSGANFVCIWWGGELVVGNSPTMGAGDFSVTYCSVPFNCGRLEKKPKLHTHGSKCVICTLWVSSKTSTTTPISLQIPKIMQYKSHLSLKTRTKLGGSTTIQTENSA